MKQILLSIVLSIAGIVSTPANAQDYLESLSYWDLATQIVRSQEIRDALDVSPSQRDLVAELLANPTLRKSIAEKEVAAIVEQNAIESSVRSDPALSSAEKIKRLKFLQARAQGVMARNYYAVANDDVERELRKILEPEQIQLLRPTALRAKFSHGLRPFEDREVLDFCELTDMWHAKKMDTVLAKKKSEYGERQSKIRFDACKRIAAALPEASQRRLVNYTGNSIAPTIPVVDDLESLSFDRFNMRLLIEAPNENGLQLTKEQLAKLMEIHEDYMNSLQAPLPAKKNRSQWSEELLQASDLAALRVLSAKQQLAARRIVGLNAIMVSPHQLFSRGDFIAYLKLTGNELAAAKQVVMLERKQTLADLRRLDREFFDSMCEQLPSASKTRLQKLFENVWEIEVEQTPGLALIGR